MPGIFSKLVRGYKNLSKQDLQTVQGTTILKGPIQITGEVSIKKPEEIEKYLLEGVEIPEFSFKVSSFGLEEDEERLHLTYPLIPEKPAKDEPIMAYAQITWNNEKGIYEYHVIEPPLTDELKNIFSKLKELIEERLNIDFNKLKKDEAKQYIRNQLEEIIKIFNIKITDQEKLILEYYIDRDFLGLGRIEPLMHDPDIEDISCDGVNIPIFVFHKNPKIGSVKTNIVFSDPEELDETLIRFAQLCGHSISILNPLLDGALPDGSRIQGTLATDIAKRGSNFTIRKFSKSPYTPTHILASETVDVKTLAFLWTAVDYGSSVLLSGGTATGKTTFLNILSLFIRPEMKIVSIEDTSEIVLPHPHWISQVARVPIASEQGKSRGEIDLFDLLRESLRQRPDYIIVGEVRGKEAYVLFQQMATGHYSLATIHAESMEKLIDRLITPPIQLPPSLIESLDIVIFVTATRYKGKFVRKVKSINEIVGFNYSENKPIFKEIIRWNSETNKFEVVNKSSILEKIRKRYGFSQKQITDEIKRRMLILNWMFQKNITDYKDVAKIIEAYYRNPSQVIDAISGEI
ncbi:MAG: type II/IV secretion system ATPase subunit [Candidatus Aenigmarchaeota archaeon]|nr:type II/IV secretion system ATPase subunit [Candidatus Aenigmarchaeota archaeon]MBU5689201.1 type II/IV secretion system ATPase subunit [Candidatus Aenigmarchaeota archaeon]